MRMWALVIVAIAQLMVHPGQAAPPSPSGDRFVEAQRAYDSGDYGSALNLYAAMAREHPRQAEVFFNLGNTLSRLGRLGSAIAAYHFVLLINPRDADAKANLRFIQSRAGLSAPNHTVAERIAGWLSYAEWKTLCLTLWWVFCTAWIVHWISAGKVVQAKLIGRAVGILLLAALVGLGETWKAINHPLVVVRTTGAKALFAPLETATPHFDAPEGLTARLLQQNDAWVEISAEHRNGWLPRSAVHIVRLDDGIEFE